MLEDLKTQAEVIAREGPTISFPRADEIIIDKRCRNLKTFSGAGFIAHEFDMTPDEIIAYRRRARQPTNHEARYGVAVRPPRPVPPRCDRAAPVLDATRNARANPNRSYAYETAEESWLAGRSK